MRAYSGSIRRTSALNSSTRTRLETCCSSPRALRSSPPCFREHFFNRLFQSEAFFSLSFLPSDSLRVIWWSRCCYCLFVVVDVARRQHLFLFLLLFARRYPLITRPRDFNFLGLHLGFGLDQASLARVPSFISSYSSFSNSCFCFCFCCSSSCDSSGVVVWLLWT